MVNDLLYSDLTYKIWGAAFNVYNELGFGHKEIVYQKALAKELENSRINFVREARIPVIYKGEKVGVYIPDFVVENKIIVEIKANYIYSPDLDRQLLNYLKVTNYNLALSINFGKEKIEIKRKIWTRKSAKSVLKSA